jgi:hypothetical protein
MKSFLRLKWTFARKRRGLCRPFKGLVALTYVPWAALRSAQGWFVSAFQAFRPRIVGPVLCQRRHELRDYERLR